MTRQKIIDAAIDVMVEMQDEDGWIPKNTGNMAFNGLRGKVTSKYVIIYVDTKVAPYVPYTNEPWISPKWNGKQNPNEGWWNRFAAEFSQRLAKKLRGVIK